MTYNRVFFVKSHLLPALLLSLLALAACEDEPGCVSDDTNGLVISFFEISDTTAQNPAGVLIAGVEPVGTRAYRIDSGEVTESQAYPLVLNPSEDVATFYVVQEDGRVDTLAVSYQREQTLISPECGPSQRYFNLDTLLGGSTFDSIRIVDREVSKLNSSTNPNIEVYSCPDFFYTDSVIINFLEKEADTTLIRGDSLFVQSIRDDRGQVLANENDTIVGTLRVPINPQEPSLTLTFDLRAHDGQPARTQTLTLVYETESVRLARQCRPETRYFDLDTVAHTFDSLHIESSELAVDVPLNIEVIDILD